ncbi:CHAB-LIKE2 [Rachiplusia nu nucleopolyhedrovirus]|uniref:CHAB-LIKE2 n=1 Tax=Rachiplusia nu nucleopolyhedrovirus TaxID=2605775 RepID=A0AAE6IRF0_9ABAC|nr:CHAB-LIKE2 [Rachiplusia nu nucleopolyhedrovirus]QEI03663.1 CHAB-LIKE2 [Rachiplusia nu nucleopolyhedrovirus]
MYNRMSELPRAAKKLPYHGKRIFMKAFNSAFRYYDSEETAFAVAWSAVKRKYKKNNSGKWVARSDANEYDTTTTESSSSSSSNEETDDDDDNDDDDDY